jgi:hypothetical protein
MKHVFRPENNMSASSTNETNTTSMPDISHLCLCNRPGSLFSFLRKMICGHLPGCQNATKATDEFIKNEFTEIGGVDQTDPDSTEMQDLSKK